jgi:predicted cupin superfamily sugar epimerase
MERIPHEGAWFTLSWVSLERAADGRRAAGSAILALVTRRDFSAMHRLRTDEIWHFYGGEAAELLLLHPGGRAERRRLGADPAAGEEPQIPVPAGVWTGARPAGGGPEAYSFFGCTLAPAFDPADYEPGRREELAAGWPGEAALIAELTREEAGPGTAAGLRGGRGRRRSTRP